MALTDTQKRDALILRSQGDSPEAIAKHVLAPVADVRRLLKVKAPAETKVETDTDPGTPPAE